MKAIGITSAALLALLLGINVPVCAQHEEQGGHEQAKSAPQHAQPAQRAAPSQQPRQTQQAAQRPAPSRQPQHAQQAQRQAPSRQPQHAQQAQRSAPNRPSQHTQQARQPAPNRQAQHAQQQAGRAQPQRSPEQQRVQQTAWQQHRAGNWQSDHRTWQQRGGYNGYRIPDARFHGYFGPEHGFRIYGLPFLVVGGYPRFQYQGYWFSLVDPWPGSWANNWYDTDDVYVSYVNNGYYLFDRRHPDVGIAISVSM